MKLPKKRTTILVSKSMRDVLEKLKVFYNVKSYNAVIKRLVNYRLGKLGIENDKD